MQLFSFKFTAKLFHTTVSKVVIFSTDMFFICGAHHEESTSNAFMLVEIEGTLHVKASEY